LQEWRDLLDNVPHLTSTLPILMLEGLGFGVYVYPNMDNDFLTFAHMCALTLCTVRYCFVLQERRDLLDNAPHLTGTLPILMPCYQWWEVPFYWAGLKAYDLIAGARFLFWLVIDIALSFSCCNWQLRCPWYWAGLTASLQACC
jgi:hypothetical protein